MKARFMSTERLEWLKANCAIVTDEVDAELKARKGGALRQFPLLGMLVEKEVGMPDSIPWEVAEGWRARIERNHGLTLEALAERGGLHAEELWLAANGKPIGALEIIEQEKLKEWVVNL
jgi:hypothetical protein